MPKQTTTYKLGYFVQGEQTDQITEDLRFRTLDAQLRGLYEVLGNGVLTGWQVGLSGKGGLYVGVTAGSGVVNFIAVESNNSTDPVGPIFPNSTMYIYADKLPDSYWNRSVSFSISTRKTNASDTILLATVTTDATTITSIDNTVRTNVGLTSAIDALVKNHRHIGGASQPQPIDLATQVQGQLSQENIPDLDASKVTTGTLSTSVIPKIDHVTGLINQGELTHAELDAFVQNLAAVGKTVMGETALTNLLQLTLALKHQWPDIDEYLVNQLAFIPGISSNTLIDTVNTTAVVDTRPQTEGGLHTISGTIGPGMTVYTTTWNSATDFAEGEMSNTSVDGDLVRIVVEESSVTLDDFDTLGDWQTKIQDLSSSPGTLELDATTKVSGEYSANVGINTQDTSNIVFTLSKTFASQDWSQYKGVVFFLNTQSIQHGKLFFYINDAVYGVQDSYTLVLNTNEPTVNNITLLNGWREIYVDLTPFNRTQINTIGFFMSTQSGWDATTPFDFNVDDIKLTRGNIFAPTGYARFIYGNGFPQSFWRVRWDSIIPTGTSVTVRTRVSNNVADFDDSSPTPAVWSSFYTSSGFILPTFGTTLYSYVQIEVDLTASTDLKSTPELLRLYLDREVSAVSSSFLYDDQNQWQSGISTNIDAITNPGSIRIASTSDVNNVFFGATGKVEQQDASLNPVFSSTGSSIPLSTRQILEDLPPGFGQVSAVKRGDNNTVWVADTDNDRVLQIDKTGNIVYGLWGSFLTTPFDGYGIEDAGPGSNVDYATPPVPSTVVNTPEALYALYNPVTQVISVVFNANLETVQNDPETTFKSNLMFLTSGAKRVYFGSDTQFSLFGINPTTLTEWALSTDPFIGQFTFASHILQATLSQADSTAIASVIPLTTPSIAVAADNEQEVITSSYLLMNYVTPNVIIGGSDNNGIRIRVNDGTYVYCRTSAIMLQQPVVGQGKNTVESTIVDGNNNPYSNTESSCTFSFFLDQTHTYDNMPRVSISSPKQGQTLTTTPVLVEFETFNWAILPIGQGVKYQIDGGVWISYNSSDPISLTGLSSGQHFVSIKLVDNSGNDVVSEGSVATVTFNYGVSASTSVSLCVGAGTIAGTSRDETTATPNAVVPVHVANINMVNLYCPIDLQVIPDETSLVNPTGNQTVLVAKLRSPSTTYCLAENVATVGQVAPPSNPAAIFASNYLDGHSVIQYGMDGEVLFTNNAAKFADTKENAKLYLGSARKVTTADLIIADAIRQRAIITRTDLSTGKPQIIWDYASDRIVADFQLGSVGIKAITVTDTDCDTPLIYIATGETVIWKNNSSSPISILSGTTSAIIFNADPDLTLYGDEFASTELAPGQQFAWTFSSGGIFNWFSYPSIITGSINVASAGVSQSDNYLIVEKDPSPSIGGARVIKVDSFGNIIWSFGEGILYNPNDVRRLANDSVIISD